MSSRIAVLVGTLAGALCAACSSTSASIAPGAPLTGRWGGMHADLSLTSEGGTIQFDCAHGAIRAPVLTDATGSFDAAGIYVREHGGPVRAGEIPDSLAAQYLGRVTGDRMRLSIRLGADTLGPYDLQLGGAAQLFRCL